MEVDVGFVTKLNSFDFALRVCSASSYRGKVFLSSHLNRDAAFICQLFQSDDGMAALTILSVLFLLL